MMQSGFYVGLSGQVALDRRMSTLAHNIANIGTAGFRAEEMKFDSLVSSVARAQTDFASTGKSYISDRSGGFTKTDNPLDVAVQGKGWLAVQTPQGVAYTKDGRFQVSDAGDLLTLTGLPVLDSGLAPIQIGSRNGDIRIAHDGSISHNGRNVATIGLFEADPSQGYTRLDNSALMLARTPDPVTSFVNNGFVQGFVEESNVNGVLEMTNLIAVTRAFDGLQTALDEGETSLKKAIQTLGG